MKIGIVADHRGYKKKQKIIKYLNKKGYDVVDYGTNSIQQVDFPDYGFKLGEEVVNGRVNYGIALCSNGIGMSIACNKVKGIRCGKVDNIKETKHAKAEDDINVIALSADKLFFEIKDIIDVFLKTKFADFKRYNRRIEKIIKYEEGNYSHEC